VVHCRIGQNELYRAASITSEPLRCLADLSTTAGLGGWMAGTDPRNRFL